MASVFSFDSKEQILSHKQVQEITIALHGSISFKQRKKANRSYYPAVAAMSLLGRTLSRSSLHKRLASMFNVIKFLVIKQALGSKH